MPTRSYLQPLLAAAVVLALAGLGGVLLFHFSPGPASGAPRWAAGASALASPPPLVIPSPSASVPALAPSASGLPKALDAMRVTSLTTWFPSSGPETFRYASTTGPVLGTSGPIRRFRVAIESNIRVIEMAAFTAKIDQTLGDPRSWIAGGKFRLQRVPASTPAAFTIYLATPNTTTRMCSPLPVGGYTSCREGSHVVLNLARWMTSVPGYRSLHVVLDTYRSYMVNHEVGHALGHDHERCPANGKPAPVMEQQTLGLHGCAPNPWPYVDGKAYDGPLGRY